MDLMDWVNGQFINVIKWAKSSPNKKVWRFSQNKNEAKSPLDLTKELLEKNAESLKEVEKEVKSQIKRDIFDEKSIKKANDTLSATQNDSLQIAQEAKKARVSELEELNKAEKELKDTPLFVKVKQSKTLNSATETLEDKKD